MHVFRTGDRVYLSRDNYRIEARVELASANGRSLALTFDAIFEGHVGLLLVMWEESRSRFESVVGGFPVTVVPILD